MKNNDKEKIIEAARDRMAEVIDADQDNRDRAYEDLQFLTGEQWPEEVRQERINDSKPVLTINRLTQFVRQVTGDIRKMNPAINVLPANDEADDETAEIIEGLIRQIEYKSDASSIYESAAEQAAACSIGWFRVLHDYEDEETFNQELLIKRIRNPFSVYCDPAAEDPTRSDAQYMFITEQMKTEDFEKAYPDAKPVDVDNDSNTDALEYWQEQGSVIVAEYYWKEPVTRKIGLLRDGTVVDDPQMPMDLVKVRTVESHKVMWAKVSGLEVLEGPIEQASKNIPVIAVTGEEWHVGEEVYRSSVIRFAKDPQQMYNFHSSALAEFVSLQPKAPYLVSLKQVNGLETLWNQANTKNRPYLPYNPDEKAPGAPQRAAPPVSSSGLMEQIMKADEDMKATTGIYDAGLGQRSNEQSGVAIRQRQMESDVATSIYSDNMAKAIGQCGRIIIEMIPHVYDTKRALRIVGKDDAQKIVTVNDQQVSLEGVTPINDLTIGRYDVRVSVGPNYTTMRQETAQGMLDFIQAFPPAANVTADLVAKSMDWPNADQFAERLKALLPEQLQMDGSEEPDPAMMQMQMAQMQEVMQQMEQALQSPEFAKAQAETVEAEADAEKAQLETQEKALELAINSGQLNAAIEQAVQQQVARVLESTFGA